MQRFAIGFLGTFIIGFSAVWIWMTTNFLTYVDGGFSMVAAKMQIADNCQLGNLVILGDSRPVADIIPSLVGSDVVNLAFGGSSPVENYFFAKRVLNCPISPKAVILSFSPTNYTGISQYVDRATFSGLLSFSDLQYIRKHRREMSAGPPYKLDFRRDIELRAKELGYAIKFPPYYFPSLKEAFVHPLAKHNRDVFNYTFMKHGWYWDVAPGNAFGRSHAEETSWDGFTPLAFNDDYLHKLLALFEARHIPVYYVGMPFNEDSFQILRPGFKEAYTAYINSVIRQYPVAHVLEPLFSAMPWVWCYDSNHLNPTGARIYSEQLRQMLNDAHVEGGPYIAVPDEIGDVNW